MPPQLNTTLIIIIKLTLLSVKESNIKTYLYFTSSYIEVGRNW